MVDSRVLTREEVLPLIPQRYPFRFVDEILELTDTRVVGRYTWDPGLDFYNGHFPGNPVTPGVLMIECMGQCGVVPLGIYFSYRDHPDDAEKITTFFTDASVDFSGVVLPGQTVTIESDLVFYRRRKVQVESQATLDDGTIVCSGKLAGMGVNT
jgi:3-hydroxyacyl-[acyl-carrier-protein] dehydratase